MFPPGPAGEGRGLCDGPSVVAEHDRWTVYSSKVNLPAALNDPRLAKRESDFFTKTWGLDFAETEVMPSFCLPNITRDHFGLYLQEMAQVTPQPPCIDHVTCLISRMFTLTCCVSGQVSPDNYSTRPTTY